MTVAFNPSGADRAPLQEFDLFNLAQGNVLLWTSLAVSFLSVRGYGLRTDEPRQGRNAATVV